jgi:hypothetical protein
VKRLFATLLLGVSLSATTVVPMSIERLTSASTDVVLATAEDSWSEWNREQTQIHTVTRFRVQRAFKGVSSETILVRRMGGRIGNLQQKVAGVRSWHNGEEAVLFLRSSDRGAAFAVTGLIQGDFRVQRRGNQAHVSNGVVDVESFDANTRKIGAFTPRRLSLDQLEREVRRHSQR